MDTTNTPKQPAILLGVAAPVRLGSDNESNIIVTADDLPTLKGWLAKHGIVLDAECRKVAIHIGPMVELPSIGDARESLKGAVAARDFALVLENVKMGGELTLNQEAYCKQCGLVVVFGASDDLAEFRGAINDEAGMDEIRLTESGKIMSEESIDALQSLLDDGTIKKAPPTRIITHTFGNEGHRFATDIPHAEFSVFEDGEPFGKGIVFHISDLKS